VAGTPAALDPRFLAAIGDPVRLQALVLLERQPTTTDALADALRLTPPATAAHLAVLVDADLIDAAADGTWRTRSRGWAEVVHLLNRAAAT
jgi:DNA-binding transcriptional ArsR family regulator